MKIILAIALALVATPALADNASQSQSGAQAGVFMNSKSAKQAPSAIAPGLAASGLSCSGSAALGGSGGGWGISLGITREDKFCNAREDAKYIQGVTGSIPAAKERLCDTPEIRAAFRRAGQPCAADVAYRPAPAVAKSFVNMKQCRAYAADHLGVTCHAR